jgi:hypothetical protein
MRGNVLGRFTHRKALEGATLAAILIAAAALVCAPRAHAQGSALASKYGGSLITYGFGDEVEIDGGFIYWVQSAPVGKKSDHVRKHTLMQRSITTGLTRELFGTTRGSIDDLAVGAGRIVFMHSVTRGANRPAQTKASVLAMSSADASPTELASATMNYVWRKSTYTRHGKKRTRRIFSSCGSSVALSSVSEIGQILITETNDECGKKTGFQIKQSIFQPDSTTASPLGLAEGEYATSLSHDLLMYSGEKSAFAKDLTTGAKHPIKFDGFMLQSATSSDGNIAAITIDFDKRNRVSSALNVYAPGATVATATIPIAANWLTANSVKFCNGTLLQISAPRGKPTRLILRDLDGNLLTQIAGPSSKNYAGATCDGHHVVVASLPKSGPVLSEYDL